MGEFFHIFDMYTMYIATKPIKKFLIHAYIELQSYFFWHKWTQNTWKIFTPNMTKQSDRHLLFYANCGSLKQLAKSGMSVGNDPSTLHAA